MINGRAEELVRKREREESGLLTGKKGKGKIENNDFFSVIS